MPRRPSAGSGRGWWGACSASGAGRADGPVGGAPAGRVAFGPVIAGLWVLGVGDRGGTPGGDVGHRGQEPVDVGWAGVEPGAGPYRARHPPPVAGEDIGSVSG